MADKGYDSQRAIDIAEKAGAIAVIAQRKMAKKPRPFDAHIYKALHSIENLFNKLKLFRRVATDMINTGKTGSDSFKSLQYAFNSNS